MSAASETQPVDAAGDAGSGAGSTGADGPIIETLDVAKHFSAGAKVPGQGRGSKPTLKAVDGVSLAIRRGETLALVGETGSGKTTFGRLLLGLYRPTSGDIRYRGTSILDRKSQAARDVRRQVQGVFQDPYSSLNPAMTIGQSTVTRTPTATLPVARGLHDLAAVTRPEQDDA
jgi:ABC-type glutathione transport system ATPase component